MSNAAHSGATAPKSHAFQWATEFCLPPTEPAYLVRGMIDLDSTSMIFGDSQAGKTFVALDRALHIAHGLPWLGRKTKKGVVLYIAAEGKSGIAKRVKAWHEHHNLDLADALIAFRTVSTPLCEPKAVTELIALIHEFLAGMDAMPVLIEIDTLAKNFGTGDENSTKDMTAFLAGMDALRMATGAAVSAVHHCGHGEKSRARGNSSLPSGLDFCYRVERAGDCVDNFVTTLTTEKCKDGEPPKPVSWKWQRQALPWTELDDNDLPVPMNSIILSPIAHIPTVKPKVLTPKQQQALDILKRLFKEARANLEADNRDPNLAKVALKHWSAAVSEFVSDRSNRTRTRNELEALKLIKISDAYVELV